MGGQMQAASPLITLSPTSPSFNSYSSGKFAEIAARVVQEFSSDTSSDIFSWTTNAADDDPAYEQFDPHVQDNSTHRETMAEECLNEEDDEEEEFEFAVVSKEADTYDASSTVADDIFYNGQIRPIYPLFNTSLISDDDNNQAEEEKSSSPPRPKPKRPQLRKLFSEERDTASSCSSSEADELDGASPGTYCVWAPKNKSEEEEKATRGGCKKSSSTGSKRWKIKNLLLHSRSNSDGKETFVFLTPPPPPPPTTTTKKGEKEGKNDNNKSIKESNNTKGKEGKLGAAVKVSSAVEEHYVMKSKDGGGDAKRRSYLPYRQDLVGFLSNVNGLGRNLHPF